jgi:hypothetical protein
MPLVIGANMNITTKYRSGPKFQKTTFLKRREGKEWQKKEP